ncbi:MAG TPA: cytochrome P450 [Burkholderiaceae bacterium]|nr:cytochrome P450 [Burkholderiaceae bacterium]
MTGTLREISDLPGPPGLPLIGNTLQLQRSRVHRNVEDWSRAYGPYFRFQLGRRMLLGLSDHEAVSTLLRDRPDGFRRTRHLETIGLEMGLTPGLFGANGEAWKRQRRMVMAGLDPTHVKAYFPSLTKVAQRLHGRWQRAARAGDAIALQPELMRYTVDAIAGLAFGADVNTLESDDEIIQQHLDKIFPALFKRVFSTVPWWRWFPSAADRALARSVAAVNAAIAGFIAQARERLAADPQRRAHPPNLLEAMIVAAADGGAGAVTDREVAGNVLTMLLAGEDTTANTLAWMIHLLHRNPDALRRACDEVRALPADAAAFTSEQIGSLAWLEACAHETMRLKPVAPFQVVEALRDTEVAGIRIPTGTAVWCVMRADSVDERHFPDPQAFRPERWLSDSGDAASSAKRVSMPFGAGPRVCPGRYLALLEIKMAMAMLLSRFDIADVEVPGGRDAEEHMAFTMMPVGLRMRLRERAGLA